MIETIKGGLYKTRIGVLMGNSVLDSLPLGLVYTRRRNKHIYDKTQDSIISHNAYSLKHR